jgi:hypothetical protein
LRDITCLKHYGRSDFGRKSEKFDRLEENTTVEVFMVVSAEIFDKLEENTTFVVFEGGKTDGNSRRTS